jgi:acyl-CoA hydrolase
MAKLLKHVKNPQEEYSRKLKSPDEAMGLIKSGDRIMYGEFVNTPDTCDEALAKRKDTLKDVWVYTNTLTFIPKISLADPTHEHFLHMDLSYSIIGRKLSDAGLCFHVPCGYNSCYKMLKESPDCPRVAIIGVCPMDSEGYFNFGPTSSLNPLFLDICDTIIVEVNTNLPKVYGGGEFAIHVSQVDAIVQGSNKPLLQVPKLEAKPADDQIARHVVSRIEDGACIQLGIGGMPNRVGELITQSDLKDLGVHTEMLVDSYVDMFEAGKITNMKKNIDKGKFVFTFAMGSDKLYNFINENPQCNIMPPIYTNDPAVIGKNDNVVSICSCIQVDLYGQVSSESVGPRQISGTGGQFDFIFGSYLSKGGKGFLCLNSTATDKEGKLSSRIVFGHEPSTAITVPRHVSHFIVTEYGVADMKAKATWQRAEDLINIAHPDFRDDLIRSAEEMKIWRRSNKIA